MNVYTKFEMYKSICFSEGKQSQKYKLGELNIPFLETDKFLRQKINKKNLGLELQFREIGPVNIYKIFLPVLVE